MTPACMLSADYVPITKETVGYIVCGIAINDAGEVLMMQEAKMTCYGEWYLPAGRMKPAETIVVSGCLWYITHSLRQGSEQLSMVYNALT